MFILQKTHDRLVEGIKAAHSDHASKLMLRIYHLEQQIEDLENELQVAKHVAEEVLPKLTQVYLSGNYHPRLNEYKLCVNIDANVVRMAFEHGDNESYMRFLAEKLSQSVYQKLVQINFGRGLHEIDRRDFSILGTEKVPHKP